MDTFKPAFRVGGFAMKFWGLAMLSPLLVASDPALEAWIFVPGAISCLVLAWLLSQLGKGDLPEIKPRALFMITFFTWVTLCLSGSLPFLFSGLEVRFVDALFESVSGITTTGSTVLVNLDSLPRSILLWRSITQWVGGIGIILLAVAILPGLQVGGMRLFRTESSEWSHLDTHHVKQVSSYIGIAYLSITILAFVTYHVLGMSWFNALNHAFTTMATGGYSTSDASFGQFDRPALIWAGSIFMFLGGCPFILYVMSVQKKQLLITKDTQVRLFLKLVIVSVVSMTLFRWLQAPTANLFELTTHTVFNIMSVITTTGYATQDYSLWGSFPVLMFAFLMFSGACSGSTSGGVKLFRYQLLRIFVEEHLVKALHRRASLTRSYQGRNVNEEVLVASLAFIFCVIISWVLSSLMLAACGLDPVTAITASLTALMNVGPGLGPTVGPAGNFSSLPDAAKYILAAAMLLGRLEYFALVIIFTRGFWKW